jgi:hypothetical protein
MTVSRRRGSEGSQPAQVSPSAEATSEIMTIAVSPVAAVIAVSNHRDQRSPSMEKASRSDGSVAGGSKVMA